MGTFFSGQEGDEIVQFGIGQSSFGRRHGSFLFTGHLGDVVFPNGLRVAGEVEKLDGKGVFVEPDAAEGFAGLGGELNEAEIGRDIGGGVLDFGFQVGGSAAGADAAERGAHAAAFRSEGMAVEAVSFGFENLLAVRGVTGDGARGDSAEGFYEGGGLPEFMRVHEGAGHFGFGDAEADDAVERAVFGGAGEFGNGEVRAFPAIAGGAVATGAAAHEEALALLDVGGCRVGVFVGNI